MTESEEAAALDYAYSYFSDSPLRQTTVDVAFLEGCRWQHSRDKAEIERLREGLEYIRDTLQYLRTTPAGERGEK